MSEVESPTILVVDDDEGVRDAFRLALSDEPYSLVIVDSGDAALDEVARLRPDLIFLDLRMPGRDGVATMRELLDRDPSLTIYIVTAFATEFVAELKAARESGLAYQMAAKPLDDAAIRRIAGSVLGRAS